jgi:hypothetical protein
LTADMLDEENTPYYLVTEPQETGQYKANYNNGHILTLPFSDIGSVTPARNWIKEHATKAGHKRHWQLDDDVQQLLIIKKGKRVKASCNYVLSNCEAFVDRYSNVAAAGLKNSQPFGYNINAPYKKNQMVYQVMLILNDLPFLWRGNYGCEDVDFSLQLLINNWCTIVFQMFQLEAATSGNTTGGHTDMYNDDGRVNRVRELQRFWSPHIVKMRRANNRPGFNVDKVWRKFDQSLIKIKQ